MGKPRYTPRLSALLILAIVLPQAVNSHAEELSAPDSKAAARALPYMAFRSFRHEERFNRQFADARFRMVVLPNLFAVTPQKRGWLEEKVFCGGKQVVFGYAPGIITDGCYDVKNVGQLTDELPPLSTRLYHLTQPGQSIKAATK